MFLVIRNITLIISLLLCISCSDKEAKQERDHAFNEYKDFVTQFEEDNKQDYSEVELRAMEQAAEENEKWVKDSTELLQQYDARKRKVVENIDLYEETQQNEFRDLETRYEKAYHKNQEMRQEVSRRYNLRKELLGLKISSDDLSNITAADLPATYEQFVQKLEQRAKGLEQRDWELVEGWWVALNNRKRALKNELTASAQNTIQQASNRYQTIHKQQM
jgi:hypothetical protein